MNDQTVGVVRLFGNKDPRYGELAAAILETVYERGAGLLFVGVLGALRVAEERLIRDHEVS